MTGTGTQVTFSGIIPLDHQDFRRCCQDSLHEQILDWLYHIYENFSLENKWGLLLIKRQHTQFYQVTTSPEMYQILNSVCLGSIQVVNTIKHFKHLKNLKRWQKLIKRRQILLPQVWIYFFTGSWSIIKNPVQFDWETYKIWAEWWDI